MNNFNKCAETYAQNIDVQKIAANLVASLAQKWINPEELTLDIGCGAGQLATMLPEYNIIGVDSAPNMCAIAQNVCNAICADARLLPFADASLNAAISSLCWQWLAPHEVAAHELARVMKPSGRAIIATLTAGTMAELQATYAKLNIESRILPYLEFAHYTEIFAKNSLRIIEIHHIKTIIQHQSAWSFFKQLQKIGANLSSELPALTPQQLQKLMRQYEDDYMQGTLPVTYNWDCWVLEKSLI